MALLIAVCCFLSRANAQSFTQTFGFTGGQQSFVVPAGVTSIDFVVNGAGGGICNNTIATGAIVNGKLAVTPGQTLYLYVGGAGSQVPPGNIFQYGGYNGGGYIYALPNTAGSGGGASDIRIGGTTYSNRVVVAGGGGGSGVSGSGGGGWGTQGYAGSNFGSAFYPNGGNGGNQTSGGAGGVTPQTSNSGVAGTFGDGGNNGGANVSLNTGGGGGGGWYGGGGSAASGGGGGSSYYNTSLTSLTSAGNGIATTGNGSITLTYPVPPVFTTQPGNVSVCPNTYTTLQSVTSATATYQWYFNGNAINGAITANLTFIANASSAGQYYVAATNAYGTTNSSTVTVSATGGLQINTQPAAVTVCNGGNTSFTVSASGTGLSYQWQVDAGNGFTNLSNITGLYSGVTTNSLQLTGAALSMSGFNYRVVVTNICGGVNSATASLTISNTTPTQPVFTSGPTSVAAGATNVTYSVTSQNNVAYTWAYTGSGATITPSGANASINFSSTASSGTVTVFAIYNNGCSGISPTASLGVTVNAPATSASWTGNVNSDWNTAGNWSSNSVPTSNTAVTISGTSNTPRISTNVTVQVGSFSIDASSLLIIDTLGKLKVYGDARTLCSIRGAGILSFSGSTAQTLTASDTIYNLEINNSAGVTLPVNSRIHIKQRYYPTLGTFTNNGTVIFISDATGTATMGRGPTGGNYFTGPVQVQQYIPGKRAYRFLAHPFTTNTALSQLTYAFDISGTSGSTNGFTNSSTNAPTAFWYNPLTANGTTTSANPGWIPYTSMTDTGVNQWNPMEGIRVMIRGTRGEGLTSATYIPSPTTLNMFGTLAQGDRTATLAANLNKGFNLIGNPYAAPIDLSLVDYGSTVGSNIWVWDAKQGVDGGYVSQPRNVSYILPAYAAFEIRATANTSATVTFHESSKVAKTPAALFKTTDDMGSNVLQLHITSDFKTQSWDRLLVYFNDSASDNNDQFDGEKLQNDDLNFYSYSADSVQQSIDVRPYVPGEVIKLGLTTDAQQIYEMSVDNLEVDPGVVVYLHDKWLHKVEMLSEGYVYEFDVTSDPASQGDNRFELDLAVPSTAGVANVTAANKLNVSIVPNPAANVAKLTYAAVESGATTLKITNVIGQQVYTQDLGNQQSGTVTIPVAELASGIYMVTLKCGDEMITKRLVKNNQ